MQIKLLEISNVIFDVIDQRMIKFSIFCIHWRKIYIPQENLWFSNDGSITQYLIETGISGKLLGLIKFCLNETYNTVCIENICVKSLFFEMV
jgi:hypothetical protein